MSDNEELDEFTVCPTCKMESCVKNLMPPDRYEYMCLTCGEQFNQPDVPVNCDPYEVY